MASSVRCLASVCRTLVLSNRCTPQVHFTRSVGFFRKNQDKAELDAEVELPESLVTQRPRRTDKDQPSMKENLNLLNQKRSLDTRRGYSPPVDAAERMEAITNSAAGQTQAENWQDTDISDPRLKYKLLTKYMQEFDHSVPNTVLTSMKTVRDAVEFFQTEVRTTHSLEDLNKLDLPKNLHIQMEPVRFDPENDKMFGGKTAYPGRNTIVSSIKYKRKFTDIKTKKEKAGYINHYYGY